MSTRPLTRWRRILPAVVIRLEFKPADCWIGVYALPQVSGWEAWVCLVPMLPLHIRCMRRARIRIWRRDRGDA